MLETNALANINADANAHSNDNINTAHTKADINASICIHTLFCGL